MEHRAHTEHIRATGSSLRTVITVVATLVVLVGEYTLMTAIYDSGQARLTYVALLTAVSIGWFYWFRRLVRRYRLLQRKVTQHDADVAGEQRHTALIENSADLVVILDADLGLSFVSPAAQKLLGYSPRELLGGALVEHFLEDDVPVFLHAVAGLRHETDEHLQLRMSHRDGRTLITEGVLSNLLAHPDVAGLVFTVRDVTERHENEQRMMHRAFHDNLTGLANRELFVDRLDHAIQPRDGEDQPVIVMYCDLDDFKEVNERFGHSIADEVLTEVGRRFRSVIRMEHTAARLGGDEFAVLLDGPSVGLGKDVAAALKEVLLPAIEVQGEAVHVTMSIGIAAGTPGSVSGEEMLRQADFAMQWAKTHGKARHEIYDARLHTRALDRLELRSELQRGLRNNELVLHYQPTVQMATGWIVGFEALVRWQHPTRGLLAPDEFIPLAEETGLVVPLGSWVLDEACRFAATLDAGASEPLSISVNIATKQLYQEAFVNEVVDVLAKTGLSPQRLVLEITETALLSDAREGQAPADGVAQDRRPARDRRLRHRLQLTVLPERAPHRRTQGRQVLHRPGGRRHAGPAPSRKRS